MPRGEEDGLWKQGSAVLKRCAQRSGKTCANTYSRWQEDFPQECASTER